MSRWAHLNNFSCFLPCSEVIFGSREWHTVQMNSWTHHKRFSVPQQSDVVPAGDFVENITNICVCCWCTKQTISWVDIFNILLLNGFYLSVRENISTLVGRFVANILCKQQQPHQNFMFISDPLPFIWISSLQMLHPKYMPLWTTRVFFHPGKCIIVLGLCPHVKTPADLLACKEVQLLEGPVIFLDAVTQYILTQ